MENESHDELSVDNLEIHFRRFRDNTKEYTMSKLVKLLIGKDFVNGLGYDDDNLDVFYVSFIINVIENFVSSENDKELLLALDGFLEGYDTMLVGKRYEAYMNYAPPLNNKIKRYWTDPNKQFHNLEKPIEKTLANRLYGDITRDNRKKLKAIAKQVIKELNESPGGFPKSPKLRTIRELPQTRDNNTEENPPPTNEIGKEDAENRKEAGFSSSKKGTAAEISSSFSEIRSGFVVDPKNGPNVISLPEKPTIANTKKVKAFNNRIYKFVAAVVVVILVGIPIFLVINAQLNENAASDESSDSMNQSLNTNPNDEDIFNSVLGTSEKTDSEEESGSEETPASTNIPNLEIEPPEGLSREVNGDGRSPYTMYQIKRGILGNKIVFNSISNSSPIGGDERNFVAAREDTANLSATTNEWNTSDVAVEDGKEYVIRLYVHNNNPGGLDAVATNTKVAFDIPSYSAKQVQVNGFISSDNAEPNIYWGHVNFIADQAFHLKYVYGSALLENEGIGKDGGIKLRDNIISKKTNGGALIGYDDLDGCVPGGYEYHNYITIRVRAIFDINYQIDNKVRLVDGADIWDDYVVAEIGDIVEFQIAYKNISDKGEIQSVTIKDILPKAGLQFISDTTKLWNSEINGGLVNPDSALIDNGIKIGAYGITNNDNQNAYVRFRAKVVEDGLACGTSTLTNWAQGSVDDITIQDHASVIVNKPYDTPELPDTDLETIDSDVN